MSASMQKRIRNDQRNDGPDKKAIAQQESELKAKKFKRNCIIAVVVIVLVLAASLFINSNYFFTKATAVQVGDTSYTAAEFNYYYRNSYNTFAQNYGDYLSYMIDPNIPLDEQVYSTDSEGVQTTWADYFTDDALNQMEQTTALSKEAAANGYTLPQESLDEIEYNIVYTDLMASSYGFTNLDTYLAAVYGKGMDEDYYRQTMIKYYTAAEYAQSIGEAYTYTDEEIKAHYTEIADTYDVITYRNYFVGSSIDRYADLADDAAKAEAARADAEAIADCFTGAEFTANILEYVDEEDKAVYEDESATLVKYTAGNIDANLKEWLTADERMPGDTTVIETNSGFYALMFENRDNNQYNTANVRHILIKAEADEEGKYSEEALADAKAIADGVLAEWQADPTEENFIALVEEYSEDSETVDNGGLYENVVKNQMVEEFDAFCFAGHEPGDTAIVYGSNGQYAGYHIMYYVSDGPIYADFIAESVLRNEDFTNFVLDLSEPYTAEKKFAFRFTDRG